MQCIRVPVHAEARANNKSCISIIEADEKHALRCVTNAPSSRSCCIPHVGWQEEQWRLQYIRLKKSTIAKAFTALRPAPKCKLQASWHMTLHGYTARAPAAQALRPCCFAAQVKGTSAHGAQHLWNRSSRITRQASVRSHGHNAWAPESHALRPGCYATPGHRISIRWGTAQHLCSCSKLDHLGQVQYRSIGTPRSALSRVCWSRRGCASEYSMRMRSSCGEAPRAPAPGIVRALRSAELESMMVLRISHQAECALSRAKPIVGSVVWTGRACGKARRHAWARTALRASIAPA